MTVLALNQIRANARKFSLEWHDAVKENAESQTFWNEFFEVFGVNRRKVGGLFEMPIKKQSGTQGRIANATLFEFGVMTSIMHNAWMRAVCGRLESRYRYSAGIVYNNFPWPLEPSDKQKTAIETAAQAVLDARAAHPDSSLADLYDPLSMPPNLTRAHQQLDKAVDAAYGKTKFNTEAERVAFLFELYQHYTAPTAPMPEPTKTKKCGKTA